MALMEVYGIKVIGFWSGHDWVKHSEQIYGMLSTELGPGQDAEGDFTQTLPTGRVFTGTLTSLWHQKAAIIQDVLTKECGLFFQIPWNTESLG